MEKIWLLIALGSLGYAIYMHTTMGYGPLVTSFYIVFVVAMAYFLMRRFMRKRMERLMEEKGEEMMQREKEKAARKAARKAQKQTKE